VLDPQTADGFTESALFAVADHEGVDPTELTPPLAEVVDPDALDRLLGSANPREDVTVEFTYRGHDVVVSADGEVTVQSLA
jgi:hypothetical protein